MLAIGAFSREPCELDQLEKLWDSLKKQPLGPIQTVRRSREPER
jgi:hypothetical protein